MLLQIQNNRCKTAFSTPTEQREHRHRHICVTPIRTLSKDSRCANDGEQRPIRKVWIFHRHDDREQPAYTQHSRMENPRDEHKHSHANTRHTQSSQTNAANENDENTPRRRRCYIHYALHALFPLFTLEPPDTPLRIRRAIHVIHTKTHTDTLHTLCLFLHNTARRTYITNILLYWVVVPLLPVPGLCAQGRTQNNYFQHDARLLLCHKGKRCEAAVCLLETRRRVCISALFLLAFLVCCGAGKCSFRKYWLTNGYFEI